MTDSKKKMSKAQAITRLWELGNLSYKLRGIQKEMRDAIVDNPGKRSTFLVSRRSGKSFSMCLVGTETCLKQKNAVVKYVCPKQKMVKTIVRPIMRTILEDCPEHLKPTYMEADKVYRFPNGSEIQFAGSDNGNIENLRGGYANLCLVDEAGFVDDLEYAVFSVLSPTTKTVRGKMVLASTPSRDPNHEFMTQFVQQAREEGSLVKYTIYDNPMFTEEIIQETIEEYPMGIEDPQFRREYLCESAADSTIMVIPEFNEKLQKDIIKEPKMPVHYDGYVSGDPAISDLTVILFAAYDFLKRQILIIDELVMGGEGDNITTQDVVDGIIRKEKLNFTNELTGEVQKPYKRIMDNNNKFLLNDLLLEHNMHFIPTAKDGKLEQVNKVRMMLKQGNIIISPKCKNLIYHLKSAKWNKTKETNRIKGFKRVKGTSDGVLKAHHCDALDALVYLVRNVDMNKNPYPANYFEHTGSDYHYPRGSKTIKETRIEDMFNTIMNIKKKR